MNPKVSFVVPCYNLAQFLPECVNSILAQTYRDLEVLIMDDCSPDATPQVAASFTDPRVRYIRNEPNIGHLPNFNKGIDLSRGEYVWVISADDKLRRPYILERYLEVMEKHPEVGYACCPAMELEGGKETRITEYAVVAKQDCIFAGRDFLKKLRNSDRVIAAAGMARKACYEQLGAFPLDLPYAHDWYLWCLFALHFDVAYFAEPMVNYRIHKTSMSASMDYGRSRLCTECNLAFHWRIAEKAEQEGASDIATIYRREMIADYAYGLSFGTDHTSSPFSLQDFHDSLAKYIQNPREANWIRSMVYAAAGDRHFWKHDLGRAGYFYDVALETNPWRATIRIKRWLLHFGKTGLAIRDGVSRPIRFLKTLRG